MKHMFTAIIMALCANSAAAQEAPDLAPIESYLSHSVAATLDAPLAQSWAFWRDHPVTDYVIQTDRIPEIESFEVYEGTWGEPGSKRRVTFKGGGSALERVLTSTPNEFSYQIWDIKTGSGRFINHIYGKFEAAEENGKTTINWSYNVKPAVFFARPFIRSFITNDFSPFMQSGMEGLKAAHTAAMSAD